MAGLLPYLDVLVSLGEDGALAGIHGELPGLHIEMDSLAPGRVAVPADLIHAVHSRLRAIVRHAELECQGHWGAVGQAAALRVGKAWARTQISIQAPSMA